MILIGTIAFPDTEELEKNVAQCYENLPPVPDFITVIGTYVYNVEGEDHRAFSIFEFDYENFNKAIEYLKLRYKTFSTVKGLTYKIEEWISVQDALKIVEDGNFDISSLSSSNLF
jgi:hypothetical protein